MKTLYLKNRFMTILLVYTLFFAGCNGKTNKETPIYNLDNITEETELKLTDLVDDIRIVPLETNDSLQLSESMFGGYKIAVTGDDIILLGDNAVNQFNAITGKFIRRLLTYGRGPQEYGNISSYTIDSKKDVLYLSHYGSTTKLAVHLKTGKILPFVPTTLPIWPDNMFMTSNGNIGIPDDTLMFREINIISGEVTPLFSNENLTKMKESSRTKFVTAFGYTTSLLNNNDLYLWNQKISDTLYKYNSPNACDGIMAICSNDINDEFKNGLNMQGSAIRIPYLDNKIAICSRYAVKCIQDKNGNLAVLNNPTQLYKIPMNNHPAQKITKFVFNPLFIMEQAGVSAAKFFNKSYSSSATSYAKILDAYIVKEAIALTLEDKSLPQDKIKALQELDSKLSENSNPVVVIGKKR